MAVAQVRIAKRTQMRRDADGSESVRGMKKNRPPRPLVGKARRYSFSPLTNNNTSHSRASSMHLTQWLDQASAVGSLLSELPGQSIQKI